MPTLEWHNKSSFGDDFIHHVEFLRTNLGVDLDESLQVSERAEISAFSSLVTSELADALLYEKWMEEENDLVSREIYSCGLPWILSKFLHWYKKRQTRSYFTLKYGLKLNKSDVCSFKLISNVIPLNELIFELA